MSEVGEWNTLLDKIRDVTLWSCGFIASLERIQEWNDLGLSSYTVPQSPVACVVAYFGVVECCPK